MLESDDRVDPAQDDFDRFFAEQLADPKVAAAYEDARERSRLILDLIAARRRGDASRESVAMAIAKGHGMRLRRARRWVDDLEGGRLMANAPLWLLTDYARAAGVRMRFTVEGGPNRG